MVSLKKHPMDCYCKFRTKKDKSRIITIRSRHYNKGTSFINDMIKDAPIPKEVFYDLELQLTWLNKICLIVPRPIIKKTTEGSEFETQSQHQAHPRLCSIDPGICTFANLFDFDGHFYDECLIIYEFTNRVKDLYLTFSNWLCHSYDYIVIPRFESHRMSQRKNRNLNNKTVRNMIHSPTVISSTLRSM